MDIFRENPLYIAGILVAVVILGAVIWTTRKAIAIVLLLAAIGGAIVWLASLGALGS